MPSTCILHRLHRNHVVVTAIVVVLGVSLGIWFAATPASNVARLLSSRVSIHGEQSAVAVANLSTLKEEAEQLQGEIKDIEQEMKKDTEEKEKKENKLKHILEHISNSSSHTTAKRRKRKKRTQSRSKYEAFRWGPISIGLAVIIGLLCTICQCGCLVWCAVLSPMSFFTTIRDSLNPFRSFYEPLDNSGAIGLAVRQEMRIMMLLPLIPLIAVNEITCEDGAPPWVYYVYLIFLVRTKLVEIRILRTFDFSWKIIPSFCLGILDHSDFFTDGVFPVQAYKCDPDATERFAYSFHHSAMPSLAPIVSTIHFYGLAYLVLSAAILSQQAAGVAEIPDDISLACAADVPGMHSVATASNIDKDAAGDAMMFISVTKVFIENCAQLWLQGSYFGLTFESTSNGGKAKLLFSIVLGMLSATCKSCQSIAVVVNASLNSVGGPLGSLGIRVFFFVIQMAILALVAWTAAKLYFAFQCESHLWNLTTGCIPPF